MRERWYNAYMITLLAFVIVWAPIIAAIAWGVHLRGVEFQEEFERQERLRRVLEDRQAEARRKQAVRIARKERELGIGIGAGASQWEPVTFSTPLETTRVENLVPYWDEPTEILPTADSSQS